MYCVYIYIYIHIHIISVVPVAPLSRHSRRATATVKGVCPRFTCYESGERVLIASQHRSPC